MNPYLLWILGLILIYLEFFIPGAVMGVIGGILVFLSVIIFASNSPSVLVTIVYFCAVATSVSLLIRFAIWHIRRAKSDYSIYSDKDQEGYVASGFDKRAIGKRGIVLSDLKPGGYILIEGKQHQAISISGYIVKGSAVEVLAGEGESLIVKSIKEG